MYALEYRHKHSMRTDPWKFLHVVAKTAQDAQVQVNNLEKMHRDTGFEFRYKVCQLISNVKPI